MNKIKRFVNKNIKWIIFSLSMLIFLILLVTIIRHDEIALDNVVADYVRSIRSDTLTSIFKYITFFGNTPMVAGMTFLMMVLVKKWKSKFCIFFNVIFVVVLNNLIKIIISRPRPIFEVMNETGFSFPSGHAMIAVGFYGFVIYFVWKFVKNNNLKWLYTILLGFLILGICISRIYLGVHYTTDVIAGSFLSLAYLIVYTRVIKKKKIL